MDIFKLIKKEKFTAVDGMRYCLYTMKKYQGLYIKMFLVFLGISMLCLFFTGAMYRYLTILTIGDTNVSTDSITLLGNVLLIFISILMEVFVFSLLCAGIKNEWKIRTTDVSIGKFIEKYLSFTGLTAIVIIIPVVIAISCLYIGVVFESNLFIFATAIGFLFLVLLLAFPLALYLTAIRYEYIANDYSLKESYAITKKVLSRNEGLMYYTIILFTIFLAIVTLLFYAYFSIAPLFKNFFVHTFAFFKISDMYMGQIRIDLALYLVYPVVVLFITLLHIGILLKYTNMKYKTDLPMYPEKYLEFVENDYKDIFNREYSSKTVEYPSESELTEDEILEKNEDI